MSLYHVHAVVRCARAYCPAARAGVAQGSLPGIQRAYPCRALAGIEGIGEMAEDSVGRSGVRRWKNVVQPAVAAEGADGRMCPGPLWYRGRSAGGRL